MDGIGRLSWIQVDCADPVALATFWSSVLGAEIDRPGLGDPPHYLALVPDRPDQPVLTFQRVPEPKTAKNRLHLDIAVDDVETATARIEDLGGRRLAGDDFAEYGFHWRVMADPEDNEFCLIFPARRRESGGRHDFAPLSVPGYWSPPVTKPLGSGPQPSAYGLPPDVDDWPEPAADAADADSAG